MPFFLLFSRPSLDLLNKGPLSLERTTAASIVGGAGGSSSSRRVDPCAELQAATERNEREAREEREAEEQRVAATRAAQETTTESAETQADAVAKAQTEAAAAERAAEALRNQPPQLIIPLCTVAPDIPVPPPEEAGHDQPAMEREGAT